MILQEKKSDMVYFTIFRYAEQELVICLVTSVL